MTIPSGMFCRAIPPATVMACHRDGLPHVAAAKADARGNALGQIVDRDRDDEEQRFAQAIRSLGMRLKVHPRHLVQMGDQTVHQIEAERAAKDARHRDQKRRQAASVFQRGQDQTDHRRRKHHACREGEDHVVQTV